MTPSMNRRAFLASTAAVLTVPLAAPKWANAVMAAQLNPYLRVESDGMVTLLSPVAEMGQGTWTGHAAIVADELGVDIASVRLTVPEQPAEPYRLFFGQMRSVGSFGVRAWIAPLRTAAAQARTVLIEAAAARLGVNASVLDVGDGHVVSTDGRRLAFAELIADAADRYA